MLLKKAEETPVVLITEKKHDGRFCAACGWVGEKGEEFCAQCGTRYSDGLSAADRMVGLSAPPSFEEKMLWKQSVAERKIASFARSDRNLFPRSMKSPKKAKLGKFYKAPKTDATRAAGFCSGCGKQNDTDTMFCPVCGMCLQPDKVTKGRKTAKFLKWQEQAALRHSIKVRRKEEKERIVKAKAIAAEQDAIDAQNAAEAAAVVEPQKND